jgi:DNA helicase-2/ATP-dependent DNA helicase PcrA
MENLFDNAYSQLNTAQKQAVDQIDGPVLVIAGPGTGKTQLLSLRIANILKQTDTLPENILCLTFTDSAAHTMRERLTSIIGQAAYGITISTYHAFGSDLLRRYPDYFSEEAELEPADNLTIDATFRSIIAALPYSNPLKHEVFLRDCKQLISDCKRALISPAELRKIATANQKFITHVSQNIRIVSPELSRVSKNSINSFRQLLTYGEAPANHAESNSVLPLKQLWHSSLHEALDEVEASGKTTALSKWKLHWLAKDAEGLFIVAGDNQNEKMHAAAEIYEQYLNALATQGLYDYDDMILRAIRGLHKYPELRYSLQERYLYLLLDEFQDTNAAQARLIELLTDNPVNEGRPNVLAVGDDDQAIYAFQGAHYSHMLNFRNHYNDTCIISLTENYRSHADILQVAAHVADQIDSRLAKQFPDVNKAITAANATLPKHATVERHEFKTALSQNAWIVERIGQCIQNGLRAHDIAVLSPKHQYLEALVPYLRQAGLPIHYDKREDVLEDPAIIQLVAMSRLIVALERDQTAAAGLWTHILSYDMWELPTSLIWQLSWQAREQKQSWTELLLVTPETRCIGLFFIRLSQIASNVSLEQMLDYILGITALELRESDLASYTSPFKAYYFGTIDADRTDTGSFWQLLSNLTMLREYVRDYRRSEQPSLMLNDFLSFVSAHQAANIKIVNTNPYQEAIDAVELMTAYRSKGQEYGAVFILASIDEVWGNKARASGSRLALPPNLQFIRYAGASEDERLRLLYVAVTRAKTHLYLTSYTSSYSGKATTRLKYLNEMQQPDGDIISPFLPISDRVVKQETTDYVPNVETLSLQWHDHHMSALHEPTMRALLQPRLISYQLSPTELNSFLNVEHDGPATFFLQSLLRFPHATTPSIAYGNAVHQTLEWIHIYNKNHAVLPSIEQTALQFEQYLWHKRLPEVETQLLLSRGVHALTAYMQQRSHTISKDAYVEYSFRNEGVFIGAAHVTGKIDKLLIDKQHKTVTIVDYKTGKSHARWERSAKLHWYKHQLYFYKLLVEQSNAFRDYRVIDAYLEFVEPDEQGNIVELHSTFDEAEMAAFSILTSNVWELIQKLQFPNVTSYSADLKGIIQFESDIIEHTI